jgi:hypothetical protein
MFFALCFMFRYTFAIVVIVLPPLNREMAAEQSEARQLPRQLDALPPIPHAQIIPICPSTFALCSDMLSLSPFYYWPPTEFGLQLQSGTG